MITVISAGKDSKTSDFALKKALEKEGKKYYIATMRVISDADKEKVSRQRKKREGLDFVTIEQDVAIVKAIDKIKWMESLLGAENRRVGLIENLQTLVKNEMFIANGEIVPYKDVNNTVLFGIAFLKEFFDDIIIVTKNYEDVNEDELTKEVQTAISQAGGDADISSETILKGKEEFMAAMKDINAAVNGFSEESFNY